MTLVAAEPIVAAAATLAKPRRPLSEHVALGVLLVVTALLYTWNLSASGWANAFYSAAAQADRQIHYFIRGEMVIGRWGRAATGSLEAADIADWVETHDTPVTVDRVLIYDLTQPPRNT